MKKLLILPLLVIVLPLCALTVGDLETAMLSSNPDVLKAREEISKAALDIRDAEAGYTPTIDLTVTGSYIANPMDPIRINLGDYISTTAYGIPNDYITVYNGQESTYYQFQLTLTQPIFTWGKLNNAVKLYRQVYDARVLQMDDAVEKARTEIRTRVAVLHYLIGIGELLDEQASLAARLVELADEAQKSGMMLATEALSVKVQARQLDVARAQTDQQVLLMMTALRNLSGIQDLQVSDVEFDEDEILSEIGNLMASGYENISARSFSGSRTTFRLLGCLGTIADLSHDIAGASVNWKPDFALVVNADYSGSRLPFAEKDWYGKDDWNATVTVALKTTVLDGGKALRNVSRTESEVTEAQLDIRSARDKIRAAVDESWTALAVCLAEMDYREAMKEQLGAQSDVDRQLLDTGYGSESDYLRGRLEYNNCCIEILRTKIELATAVYTLLYLQGEI